MRGTIAKRLSYYVTIGILNCGSLLVLWHISHPPLRQPVYALPATQTYLVQPLDLKVVQGLPVRITIPRLQIDIPVEPGNYDAIHNSWNLSDSAAQYATVTPQLNDHAGNTLIYGHNSWNIFGRIPELRPGDTATVYSEHGQRFVYRFKTATDVLPSDMTVFGFTLLPQLTIQTCSGNWNEKRHMATFEFVRVES